MFKNRKEAWTIVGGLSAPSKMPCWGYSIPATECKIGKLMRDNPLMICSKCYALKGRYVFRNVKEALYRRFNSLLDPRWTAAMSYLIKGMEYFRWHDAGDIQNVEHLKNIVQVAVNTPETRHWLPTREYEMVKNFFEAGNICPDNLTIRLSALKIDGPAPEAMAMKYKIHVSGVSKIAYTCPASKQGNACVDCRACWDKETWNASYKQH